MFCEDEPLVSEQHDHHTNQSHLGLTFGLAAGVVSFPVSPPFLNFEVQNIRP